MATRLFSSSGGVYRGNLHGHSTHSDGRNSSAEVVELYRAAGYDFTCLSEHLWSNPRFSAPTIIDATTFDSPDFVTIISAELHCRGKAHDRDGLWHVVANGLPSDFPMAGDTETGPEMVRRAVAAGAYVTIAHPEWYCLTDEEARGLAVAGAHGVEVYNHSSAIESARGGGIATLDLLLHEGHRLHLTATDDSHHIPDDAFGGWVMVAADRLNEADIVAALKDGNFYASSGPDFTELTIDGTTLHVGTSPVERVILAADKHQAQMVTGEDLTMARFDLASLDSAFFRVVAMDRQGRSAWSNPCWMEAIG
jgi:histidinol phosphatase-like PHP family hydrolase